MPHPADRIPPSCHRAGDCYTLNCSAGPCRRPPPTVPLGRHSLVVPYNLNPDAPVEMHSLSAPYRRLPAVPLAALQPLPPRPTPSHPPLPLLPHSPAAPPERHSSRSDPSAVASTCASLGSRWRRTCAPSTLGSSAAVAAAWGTGASAEAKQALKVHKYGRTGAGACGFFPLSHERMAELAPQPFHFSMIMQSLRPRLEQSPRRSSQRMRCSTFRRRCVTASQRRSLPWRRCKRA